MQCRTGCGACCIIPSISSPIPGMPDGKPAGVRCVQLDEQNCCKLFNDPRRPDVCHRFQPSYDVCQDSRENAMSALKTLEQLTRPEV
ncbi:MAG: YkgJ family cysteine cluster protein [Gammaproteobacteria bacterium]|nr:YkgJ family cysteine cluster protein [Gammaproteobacteria bacterium]